MDGLSIFDVIQPLYGDTLGCFLPKRTLRNPLLTPAHLEGTRRVEGRRSANVS